MLFLTVLIVVTSSVFAAPQYYYSNLNRDISSRQGRSKKCPSGFLMNAVNDCVQPEIERFFFLFESPKVPVIQPQDHLAGNAYRNNPAISPYFFLVQPEVTHTPSSGVQPFTSYPSGQYQQPNSLFVQHTNTNLQKNSFPNKNSQTDSIDESSLENELSFDYSRQYQPSSDYQSLNQNLLQESRQEVNNPVTRITSFHPPSATFKIPSTISRPTSQTVLKQTNKNTEIPSSLSDEIKSADITDQVSVLNTFDQQPSSALTHSDGGISSSPVEEGLSISPVYQSGPDNGLSIPSTNQQSNSISRDTTNDNVHSTGDTFQSSSDDTALEPVAELIMVEKHANEDLQQVIATDTDLRIGNEESGSSTVDQQLLQALTHNDGEITSLPVSKDRPILTSYNGGAANFFTVPGTVKQSNSGSRTTFNKGSVNTFYNSGDDTGTKLDARHSNEDIDSVNADDTESAEIVPKPSSTLTYIDGGINSSPVEEVLSFSRGNNGGVTNFFTVPGANKQSSSASKATSSKGTVNNIYSTVLDNTAILPLEKHSNEDLDPVSPVATDSTVDLIDLRIGNIGSGSSTTDQQSSLVLINIDNVISSLPVKEEQSISTANKGGATNFFTLPGTNKRHNTVSRPTFNKNNVNNFQSEDNTFQSARDDTAIELVARQSNKDIDQLINLNAGDSLGLDSGDEDQSNEDGDDIVSTETIDESQVFEPINKANNVAEVIDDSNDDHDKDQTAQESVSNKKSPNVYFVQSELLGGTPAISSSAVQPQGNFNRGNNELLSKTSGRINNKFSFGNQGSNNRELQLNKMFDHIKANLTNGLVNPDSYKGFVYIVADEGKEIVYEF